MDLSVKANLALADGGMDLSVNRTTCELPDNTVDSSIEKSEQESDDDNTSLSMTSGSESDDLEMDLSIKKTDRQLRVLRHRTTRVTPVDTADSSIENELRQSEDDNSDFRLSSCSESEDIEMDLSIKTETRRQLEYSVMDLRVHVNQNTTKIGVHERTEIKTALAYDTELAEDVDEERADDSSTDESSGSEDEAEESARGENTEQTSTTKREGGRSPVDSDTGESNGMEQELTTEAQFQRELQLFSEKQFPIGLQQAFASNEGAGRQVNEQETEEDEDAKPGPQDPEGGHPFLNVADFLELETKVTGEASVETHATEVTFTCTACDLSFSSTLYLTQHVKHCRKLKANCFKPHEPSAVLAENGPKTETAKSKGGANPVISNCTYRSNPGVKKKKPGYVLATCNICGKDLRNNRSLKQHMFLHRLEAGERPFACAECPASFTQNCDLTKHKRQHTGEKPYACDSCDAKFTLVSNLSKHRKKHTGEKPHVCPECGATFAESGSLTRHARQHSGERPYACADCGATFGQSSSLTRHKRKHTGERPYVCDVCDARFTESGNLNSHRRLHTGEKPYTCPRCGQGHARLSYLKNHARTCRTLLAS